MDPREAHVNPNPAVDWVINLLAENGNALIGIGTLALVAFWWGVCALRRRIEHRARQRRQRRADLDTCIAIWNASQDREEKP